MYRSDCLTNITTYIFYKNTVVVVVIVVVIVTVDLSVKYEDLKNLFGEFGAISISNPRIDHTGSITNY